MIIVVILRFASYRFRQRFSLFCRQNLGQRLGIVEDETVQTGEHAGAFGCGEAGEGRLRLARSANCVGRLVDGAVRSVAECRAC